jgi:hypothetical protein
MLPLARLLRPLLMLLGLLRLRLALRGLLRMLLRGSFLLLLLGMGGYHRDCKQDSCRNGDNSKQIHIYS